jgi:formyl-CoA transferase
VDKDEFFASARTDLTGPLAGVRVVDLTTAWSGPMASCVLADLGCDVIHIDQPGGPGPQIRPLLPGTELSYIQQTVNRNKRSLTADLRAPQSRDLVLELIRVSDIVIENFRPGTLDEWGLGYRDCVAVKPDIVYVSISGWGQYGERSRHGGYDPVALAASGWLSLTGDRDGPPVKSPTFLADDISGLHAAIGAMAALRHRDQTAEGQHVDVSMLDSMLFQSSGLLTLAAMGAPAARWGNELPGMVPCNVYACADGHVYVAVVLDHQWDRLARAMDRAELAGAPGYATAAERVANRDTINALVQDWCAARNADDAVAAIVATGVTAARVDTYSQAASARYVQERDMLQPTLLEDGSRAPLIGPATKFSRTPTRVRHAAPRAGAHTEEILAELGVSQSRREELRAKGVI